MKHFPTLNLNGTSYDDLVEQHEDVIAALNNALAKIETAEPHGRDFLQSGHRNRAEIFEIALREHSARYTTIRGIRDEYAKGLQHIVEEHLERERMRGR